MSAFKIALCLAVAVAAVARCDRPVYGKYRSAYKPSYLPTPYVASYYDDDDDGADYASPSYSVSTYKPSYSSYKPTYTKSSYDSDYSDKYANYHYDYAVKDDYSGNHFGHTEKRDGYKTTGEYRVLLPDGRYQIVSYIADENGYRANVHYEGEAHYDSPKASAYTYRPSYSPYKSSSYY